MTRSKLSNPKSVEMTCLLSGWVTRLCHALQSKSLMQWWLKHRNIHYKKQSCRWKRSNQPFCVEVLQIQHGQPSKKSWTFWTYNHRNTNTAKHSRNGQASCPDHLQFGGIKVPGPDWIVLKDWVLARGTIAQRSEWQVWFTFQETPVFQPWYKDSHISHQQTVSVSLPQWVPGTEDRILITFGS